METLIVTDRALADEFIEMDATAIALNAAASATRARTPLEQTVLAHRVGWRTNRKFVNSLTRKTHINDAKIAGWLCFPGKRAEEGLLGGALVMTSDLFTDDTTKVPSPWQTLPQYQKPYTWMRALVDSGPTVKFTLDLGDDIIAKGRAQEQGLLDYVRRRMCRFLRHFMGHAPDFWCAIEVSKANNPHIHGSIALSDRELSRAREALLYVVGSVPGNFLPYAVDFGEHYDPAGWVRYCLKDLGKTSQMISGALVTSTRSLNYVAKRIYVSRRSSFIAQKRLNKRWPSTNK